MLTRKTLLSVFSANLVISWVAEAQTAKATWQSLIPENLAKNPSFRYVKNDAKLPNVLLYGDSISIGYTNPVRGALAGKANVYRIHCNGGHSAAFIPRMLQMQRAMRDEKLADPWDFQWDVIHFNVGLHDLKYIDSNKKLDKKNGKLVSSPEVYEEELVKVLEFLKKEYPGTKLIFATTTPVPAGEPGRIEGDAARYNAIALEVLKKYPEVEINDLYSFTKPHQSKWWVKPGDVHYKGAGRNQQGKEVAKVIEKFLRAE
jgi:hypothetical protein